MNERPQILLVPSWSEVQWAIKPLLVFGSDSAKSTMRGYLYGAVSDFTWSWSCFLSSSVASVPSRRTTTARTI